MKLTKQNVLDAIDSKLSQLASGWEKHEVYAIQALKEVKAAISKMKEAKSQHV